jgi:hypothetical protein
MICNSSEDEHEISARVIKTFAKSGNGERLAWGSSDEKLKRSCCNWPLLVFSHVPKVLHGWESVSENGARERFDF